MMNSKPVWRHKNWLLPCLLLFFAFILYFNFRDYLSVAAIQQYHGSVQQWTNTHYKLAATLYLLIFVILVACAIPCATALALLGGFLFGMTAVFFAVFSTTLGGTLLYLVVRTSFGHRIAAKSSGWIKKLEHGFKENAFNYILMLRLTPVFPCWLSNVTAGLLNVPLKTFILATVIGILPATWLYVLIGQGLDKLISNDQFSFSNIILSPSTFFPLLALGMFSIVPIIYKSVKKHIKNR